MHVTTDTAMPIEIEQMFYNIIRILLPYRRSDSDHEHEGTALYNCFAPQFGQFLPFIADRAPVLFTLPAFPCKSPNERKVLGHLPDMGERASLCFLQRVCQKIEEVYPPGARILICSDGHVFGDLIRVPDEHITDYAKALREMAVEEGASSLEFFSLEDVSGSQTFDEKRSQLSAEFAEPIAYLREQVRHDDKALALYRGITRFLVEDACSTHEGTKSALLRDCRQRAYGVVQRSRAWSNLIAGYYPRSVRLSIHPQPCGSLKFGIALLESTDNWVTPWHSVAVHQPDGMLTLMKRSEAEKVGRVAFLNGVPSHFIVSEQDAW
jgi:pyoverdine/dityrosine biosynthesis protein Dit1